MSLANTPPEIALALGFFIALSLRQGRLGVIIDKFLPTEEE